MNERIPRPFAIPFIVVLAGVIYLAATHFSADYLLPIILGFMLTTLPLIVIFTSGSDKKGGDPKKKRVKSKLLGAFIGFVFSVIGLGMTAMMSMDDGKFSFLVDLRGAPVSEKALGLVPVGFVFLGIYMIAASLFGRHAPKIVELKVLTVDRDGVDGLYTVLLSDEVVGKSSIRAITQKYFLYATDNGELFKENSVFQVDLGKYGSVFSCRSVDAVAQARVLDKYVDEDFIRR